jgi:hypothetical protein
MSPNNEATTAVSFANEVEEEQAAAAASTLNRKASSELRQCKDRASLSQSAKAWDLDGDGELDDAELALREMDKSHRGTLTKDQMYKLMSDNLQTQRELFKVKKVVMGLVAFTCVLAVSNLGTSLAAAFLAKDTKAEGDELKSTATGRTLATESTSEVFTVDLEFDQQFSRRHRQLCGSAGGGGVSCGVTDFSAVDFDMGKTMVNKCIQGKSVTIEKIFTIDGTDHHVAHTVCPVSGTYTSTGGGNGPDASPPGIQIPGSVNILPADDESAYTISPDLKSPTGSACLVNDDCIANHSCESNVCKANPGITCTVAGTSQCTENFTCEAPSYCPSCDMSCVCASDAACGSNFACMEGNGGKACVCANDDACGEGEMCTTDCGAADQTPGCTTQAALDENCVLNYGYLGHNTCDTKTKQCYDSTATDGDVVVALPFLPGDGR